MARPSPKRKKMSREDAEFVPEKTMERLYEKIEALLRKEFDADADGDLPVEFVLVDRTREQRLHYAPVPYGPFEVARRRPEMTEEDKERLRLQALKIANMNLGYAQNEMRLQVDTYFDARMRAMRGDKV